MKTTEIGECGDEDITRFGVDCGSEMPRLRKRTGYNKK